MTKSIKPNILESLIRVCIKEVFDQTKVEADTVGAPAPPAGGLGTADQPPVPQKRLNELKSLIKHIVKHTINELSSFGAMSTQDQASAISSDPTQPPLDAMSPIEKAKQEREQEKLRQDAIKQGEAELKSVKAEREKNKAQSDQIKRFKEPMLQKRLQQLKGGI